MILSRHQQINAGLLPIVNNPHPDTIASEEIAIPVIMGNGAQIQFHRDGGVNSGESQGKKAVVAVIIG